jgi:hypothetical protein
VVISSAVRGNTVGGSGVTGKWRWSAVMVMWFQVACSGGFQQWWSVGSAVARHAGGGAEWLEVVLISDKQ